MPMVFSASFFFLSHASYLFSHIISISEKGSSRCLLNLIRELYTCSIESAYPSLPVSLNAAISSLNTAPTVTGFFLFWTFSIRVVAVKSIFSVFSSTILLLTSLIFLDIRLSSISLSGQVSFGLLFSKSQCSGLVETPRLIYLVFLSLHTLILRGNSPFFNGLYL